MKKIICVLMCLSLCLCLFGCGSNEPTELGPIAQNESTPVAQNEFRGKDVTGAVGDTVEVVFELGKDTPIAAADFIIEYDSSTLKYVETTQIYKFQSGYVMGNSPELGRAKVSLVTLDPPTNGGDIFSVSFEILKECKKGSEIKISTSSCCDSEYKKIDLTCKGAKIFSK